MKSHLFSPSSLKQLLAQYGFSPSKQYGQNYLISDAPIKKMVAAAKIGKDDTVVEIGPGFGVLTFALAEAAKHVVAFEIEKKLQPYWEEHIKEHGNIEIVWGNALRQMEGHLPKKFKLVANLPYQITSHVLREVLEADHKPETMVVMVQKEVAERICAKPGDMSVLAVSVQYFGKPKMVTKVTKGNFFPMPKVDSAVLAIEDIQDRPHAEEFFTIVRAGFHNKRKQLWRNLSEGLGIEKEVTKKALRDVGLDERVRAQELSVQHWEDLRNTIKETQS